MLKFYQKVASVKQCLYVKFDFIQCLQVTFLVKKKTVASNTWNIGVCDLSL